MYGSFSGAEVAEVSPVCQAGWCRFWGAVSSHTGRWMLPSIKNLAEVMLGNPSDFHPILSFRAHSLKRVCLV